MGRIKSILLNGTVLLFILLIVAVMSGGQLFTAFGDTPYTGDAGNLSDESEFGEIADRVSLLQKNGTFVGVNDQKVQVSYSNDSTRTTRLSNLVLVSNSTAHQFNVSGQCYTSVVTEFSEYSSQDRSTVQIIPIRGLENGTLTSRVLIQESETFLGVELLERGYAKINESVEVSSNASEPFVSAQESARSSGVGVWAC